MLHHKHKQHRYRPWASAGGGNGHLPPLETGTKNQNFQENMNPTAQFRLIVFILAMTVYLPVWHSLTQHKKWFWGNAVVSLQFTRIRCLALPNMGAGSSAFGLYCATIAWQHILKGLLQPSSYDYDRAVASGWASGARPPIWNLCPSISCLAPWLLHTSNTVF